MSESRMILCGDARELIAGVPVDALLVSDPPYNQRYHYGEYADNLAESEYLQLLKNVFGGRRAVIILYPEQAINLLGGGNMGRCEEVVCWVYNSNTGKQSRLVTWWNCKPDFRKVPQEYKNPKDKRIAARIAAGKRARSYDWWEINQVKNVSKKHSHPCPIPEELARRIILATSKEGELIVDPFNGSGTVTVAAQKEGRLYLGFDIDSQYCAEAMLRHRECADNNTNVTKEGGAE